MLLMLDSSACIDIMRRRSGGIARVLVEAGDAAPILSSIVVAELEYGVARAGHSEASRAKLEELLERCELRNFDAAAARCYGPLRAELRAVGKEVGPLDFLIAAHALSLGASLMTGNLAEFRRVPGLEVIPLPSA